MRLRMIWYVMGCLLFGASQATANVPDSIAVLIAATQKKDGDASTWLRLGRAYLDLEQWDDAQKAFGEARRGALGAQAYHGIGLAYLGKKDKRRAMQNFRRALSKDKTFLDAQMDLARTYIAFGDPEAESAFKRAIAIDSTYVPAYVALAAWYAEHEYFDEMADLYRTYLKMYPGDQEAYYQLGIREIEGKRYAQILSLSKALKEAHLYEPRWLPMEAQALASRGQFDDALDIFQRFFVALPDSERAYYEDLSLVAFPDELTDYENTPLVRREAFLRRFWQRRDPTLVAWGKARRAEHYRRVWHARTFFAKVTDPWDKRGEVYVRFGEPDYRSYGYKYSPPPPLAVENVKIRTYQDSVNAANRIFDKLPLEVQEARRQAAREYGFDPPGMSNIPDTYVHPAYPLDPEFSIDGSWESWVYTGIGRGVEFVFVRWVGDGYWEFAPIPKQLSGNLEMARFLLDHNPTRVYEEVIQKTPTYYTTPHGAEPLDFYYDLATFKSDKDKTLVDVYSGIPFGHLESAEEMGEKMVHIERTLALSDVQGETVYRTVDAMGLNVSGIQQPFGDQFCVDVARLNVPPGEYRLAIQVTDRVSGTWGLYVQEVTVPAYENLLGMSDLILANHIDDTPQHPKFQKGDVWVTPMPSRSYLEGQNPYVYYEVYNLEKDEFGQTKYQVTYTVKRDFRKGVGVFGALASVVRRIFTSGKPEISLQYERVGNAESESIYFELDEGDIRPGLCELEVQVTDLNTGLATSKSAMFLVGQAISEERMAKKRYVEEAQHFARDMIKEQQAREAEERRREQEILEQEKKDEEYKRSQRNK